MMINQYGQPVGDPLPDWKTLVRPKGRSLLGKFCRLEALNSERDFSALFAAYQQAADPRDWTYLMGERPETPEAMRAYLETMYANPTLVNMVVFDLLSEKPIGTLAFMRIEETLGVLEIGHINWSPLMKRQPYGTEAIFLMLRHAFDELGYRRCEWKCDSLNAPSRQAAERFGFNYEGRFLNAVVTKGRSRDTDWFALTNERWPTVRSMFEHWLDDQNFTVDGQQKRRLQDFLVSQ